MHRDLQSFGEDAQISFTPLAGDVNCEWPPGLLDEAEAPGDRSYIVQQAIVRMKPGMPKIERTPKKDDDWTYTTPQAVKKMCDPFYSDAQFLFKGVVCDGTGSDHRPFLGEVFERTLELLHFGQERQPDLRAWRPSEISARRLARRRVSPDLRSGSARCTRARRGGVTEGDAIRPARSAQLP